MMPKMPKSIKNGHKNLCAELKTIANQPGAIGEKARLLEKVMYPHFKKEEKYALPPLGLLLALSEQHWEIDSEAAIKMADTLQSNLLDLQKDHENISKVMGDLKVAAEGENNHIVKQFIKDLTLHVEIEDQVLYPATILIGNYLKNLK